MFNQRVNQYKKKNLFRIIKDGYTIDYSWLKTSEIVSGYRSSINHILFEIESENKIVLPDGERTGADLKPSNSVIFIGGIEAVTA